MSYISGNLGEDSRIFVYDTNRGEFVYNSVVSAGPYQIEGLTQYSKHIFAVNETTGESFAYGNISPAGTPIVLSESFDGLTLDTEVWDESIVPNASITVNDRLELNNIAGSSWSGAHIITKSSWSPTGAYKLNFKWDPHTNHYSSGEHPYVAFVDSAGYSPSSNYGEPTTGMVRLKLGRQNDTSARTGFELLVPTASVIASATFAIDESQYNDVEFLYDIQNATVTVKLNDVEVLSRTDMPSISSWTGLKLMIGTADYNKSNTELFDEVDLSYA